MRKDSILDYAGDLSVELEEIETAYTQTYMCDTFFTLKCC